MICVINSFPVSCDFIFSFSNPFILLFCFLSIFIYVSCKLTCQKYLCKVQPQCHMKNVIYLQDASFKHSSCDDTSQATKISVGFSFLKEIILMLNCMIMLKGYKVWGINLRNCQMSFLCIFVLTFCGFFHLLANK